MLLGFIFLCFLGFLAYLVYRHLAPSSPSPYGRECRPDGEAIPHMIYRVKPVEGKPVCSETKKCKPEDSGGIVVARHLRGSACQPEFTESYPGENDVYLTCRGYAQTQPTRTDKGGDDCEDGKSYFIKATPCHILNDFRCAKCTADSAATPGTGTNIGDPCASSSGHPGYWVECDCRTQRRMCQMRQTTRECLRCDTDKRMPDINNHLELLEHRDCWKECDCEKE